MSFNFEEEIIDGHLVTAETKRLWAVEMDLAKKLLEVCKIHGLKIWATDGTLLGAVRHKGFIPWDDDMDFCMMRNDYNRLIEIGPKVFQEPYFFQSFYTDNNFWGGMIKLRRSDTAMIEKSYMNHSNLHRGIAIDVFVLDAIPNDKKEFKKIYNKVSFLRRMLHNYRLFIPDHTSLYATIRHALISLYFKIKDPLSVQKRIVSLLSKYSFEENEYCGIIDYYALKGYDDSRIKYRNICYYDETVFLPFHDMQVPAPREYDKLLRISYGDYMKPIKGTQSHTVFLFDTERSYKEVLAELRKK